MRMGSKGIALLRKYEGIRLEAYDDLQPNVKLTATTKIKGKLTIGIGHTGLVDGKPIAWDTKITEAKAIQLLQEEDIIKAQKAVDKYQKKYNWTQNEYDALTCFAFNIGNINQLTANGTRSRDVICAKLTAYNKSGGVVLDGLTNRRKAEQALFNLK